MITPPDWEERYRSGATPWEKGSGAPGLADFLAEHPTMPRGRVLVPGCGTGHDVRLWARHGFAACGLDLAPSAIQVAGERTCEAGLAAEFRLGDFLRDPPPAEPFDWIFEHTLFCAIRPDERDLYQAALPRWLAPGGQYLAIHYMLREGAKEPPFGCSQEELQERFAPAFELVRGWVPRSYPNRTGLELMLWWRRRPPAPTAPPTAG